jgi:hypothetical protein
MGGGIALRKKTRLLQHKLIWHLILLRKVASTTSCDKVLGIIAATFSYWDDVIDSRRIHPAPVTLSTIP